MGVTIATMQTWETGKLNNFFFAWGNCWVLSLSYTHTHTGHFSRHTYQIHYFVGNQLQRINSQCCTAETKYITSQSLSAHCCFWRIVIVIIYLQSGLYSMWYWLSISSQYSPVFLSSISTLCIFFSLLHFTCRPKTSEASPGMPFP